MALTVRLLGPPLVDVDGRPLAVDTRKAIALLAYLAVENHAVRRDTLAARLWPNGDSTRARAALRRTLSALRAGLDDGRLDLAGDAVTLRTAGIDLDVTRFRSLAASGSLDDLRAAVRLHRGPFLDGFGLRDAPDFDDWQQLVGDELRRELAAALERLADAEAAAGLAPAAIAAARRRLALDPLHEPAHRRLMELYAAAGDRAAALAQYRECVRQLHRELGVAPLEETTALYRAIREGTSAPPPPAPAPGAAAPAALPLVGRTGELRELLDALRSADRDGRVAVVEGEAGIGKTRLVDELVAAARGAGGATATARCFEDESGLTYGAVADLLRSALRGRADAPPLPAEAAAEAARLLPELGPPAAEPLDGPGAQARFFEGVLTALLSAATGGPLVAVVDDVHWLDAASANLLAYAARRLRGRPLLLVLTRRSDAPSRLQPPEPLTIRLGRLGPSEVAALAAAAGAPAELADRLHAETGGLPFLVAEYLQSPPGASGDWPLPVGVRELLEARLAAASEVAAQVASAAAVLGRPFDLDLVRAVSGRTDDEVVAALEELTARGILAEGDGARYDFRHDQARRVAYEMTSAGRRRLLHRRAAEAVAASARGAAAAALVAQHFRLAGRDADAADWFRRAGDEARALYANEDALASYREALLLGHADAVALHVAIGDLETLAGAYGAALASYETAAANASAQELAAIEHRIGGVHHRRGEWELAEASFEVAAATLREAAAAERARLAADRSLNAHRRGRDGEAQARAEESLRLAASAGDRRALAQAHNLLGILALDGGRADEARRQLEQSLAFAGPDDAARAAALNNLALVQRATGDLVGAVASTEEALALAARVGDRHRRAALLNNAADLMHAAGRRDASMAYLKEAVSLFAQVDEPRSPEPEIWKLREW